MSRKIIQFQVVPARLFLDGYIVALCDDGTLWHLNPKKVRWDLVDIPIFQGDINDIPLKHRSTS